MSEEQYVGTTLKSEFYINKLYTVHYFEYANDFAFQGESHDFWELIYSDKGGINISAGSETLLLPDGGCYFHKPGEWHSLRANGETAPDLIVISFDCDSPSMNTLAGKIITLTNDEKRLLGGIIKEAMTAFCGPFGNPYTKKLTRRRGGDNTAEQMVGLLLQQLLISFERNILYSEKYKSPSKVRFDGDIINNVLSFLEENTEQKLRFKDITDYANISATALKTLFRKRVGCGVMEYFTNLKIKRAKRLMRENNLNFTEISRLLGYDSLHYFSRQFKQKTGMSPTEYLNSARMIIEEKEKEKHHKI
ncbi:MAG: helix-turn-helix transcriptional regulator [Clostridia bacterium]|nr:helix-turn-helix transcriptional regulator [Clostridia bacterium]